MMSDGQQEVSIFPPVADEFEVTDEMREAGAMKLLEVRSCMCETEEDAAEAIFRAMVLAMLHSSLG
jgi:hypothetical protein